MPNFDERHESAYPTAKKLKQDEFKEIHIEKHYNQVVESQKERLLKPAKEKLLIMHKESQ